MALIGTEDQPLAKSERVPSRDRAVSRVVKGVVVGAIGWTGLIAVPVADFLFGASQTFQELLSIGSRSLVWLGVFIAASAGTHLLRFGGRRGVMAFASFAAAGVCGLIAVGEQLETWFLDTDFLSGLDLWGLVGAVVFIFLGLSLLRESAAGVADTPADG